VDLRDVGTLALQAGLDSEGAMVAMAIAQTEGGLRGAVGDYGRSFGPFQFYAGGQLNSFARDLGVSPAEAAQIATSQPDLAVQWALQPGGYLGDTIRAGQRQGLRGADLATYAQRHAQVSVSPDRAGTNYSILWGNQNPSDVGQRLSAAASAPPSIQDAYAQQYGGSAAPSGTPSLQDALQQAGLGTAALGAPSLQDALQQQYAPATTDEWARSSGGAWPTTSDAWANAAPTLDDAYAQARAGGRVFPVSGYTGTINTHWGSVRGGSDLMAPRGTPINVMQSGTVLNSGWDNVGGNSLLVKGDDGLQYYYAHFDQPSPIKTGQRVNAGDYVAPVGNTGDASAGPTHLHIGIGPSIRLGADKYGGTGGDYDAVGLLQDTLSSGSSGWSDVAAPSIQDALAQAAAAG
jgi:murein DD-endopeptidase MepM/ murein hydrolase activator NlpD